MMSDRIFDMVRPDGRLLVWPAGEWTREAAAAAAHLVDRRGRPALAHVFDDDEGARAVLTRAGFVEARRQAVVSIPVGRALAALADSNPPSGIQLRSAADVDRERLRLLDDELRQDVPGTSGWRSTPKEFDEHNFDDPAFDPRTYLVAVDQRSGEYVGLARIWMNESGPRLGMVGVRRAVRRQGIAAALLSRAFEAVLATGATEVTTEYDVRNAASTALFARLGARRSGTEVELIYDPTSSQTAFGPVQRHSRV